MKVDFKKSIASYKAKSGQFSVIEVPTMNFIAINGDKGPASKEFTAAIETLYPVAYHLKFMSKRSLEKDYVVPPLEAIWWARDMDAFTTKFDQSQWEWTAMIMVPDWITDAMVQSSLSDVTAKKAPPSIDKLRLTQIDEGICVQTMHIGSYSDEGPVLKEMHEKFIPNNGLQMRGKHHEIYFNDFRKVAPEKLRTMLRQPVTT
ncbi:GyrI-like domain-containing protein [Rubripirellula reticaptiva]|uniref:Bacterial transcription activator, effector binding domain n=1 Tax=Rubripirellula reticaptiva TaxID=2528013 RepID=A0A5C6EU22_9BACT|nr:GyrI-like domain-containing protein [Rubripirellula reticaptiva]TWU51577.1 Bacterial transcription activator, effector binding domain [Rubripirellula reticaptiva]